MATRPLRERVAYAALTQPSVLAVSGGADSMVMAAMQCAADQQQVRVIATFDHGTGRFARDAVAMVSDWALERGIAVRTARSASTARSEAAWRRERWEFLRAVSREFGCPVATAHTEDDQAETVFIRLLRQSGVRGLAGLLAPGPVRRPMLEVSRADVRAAANAFDVPYLDDPSNTDLRFLRNRVRLDLLPALERESPGFREWLLALGRRAAQWRGDVSAAVDRHWAPVVETAEQRIVVRRDRTRQPTVDEAGLFWPEVAGRVGVALDRRGTARLASFTTKVESGLQMPLSGGATVTIERDSWSLERRGSGAEERSRPIGWHHAEGG
ncbi:MAG TPA: tRNA lysidine(34) synthetase TilS [Gemmatimonadaceae bacterium]|nr:tRNA lysidine(34) synthetase TilS [Gemmatimonadaceae bacterium]